MNRRIRVLGLMGSVAIAASVMLASTALAASVTPTFATGTVPNSACSGAQHVVSIDSSGLHTSGSFNYVSPGFGAEIKVTYHGGSPFPYASDTSFDFVVIQGPGLPVAVSQVWVESANQFQTAAWTGHNLYDYGLTPATSDTGLVGPTQTGQTDPTASVIDMIGFCVNGAAAPTAAPTAAPSATPLPSGSVAAASGGTAGPTVPPTDALGSRSPSDPCLALIVVAMALVTLTAVLIVTPARRRR